MLPLIARSLLSAPSLLRSVPSLEPTHRKGRDTEDMTSRELLREIEDNADTLAQKITAFEGAWNVVGNACSQLSADLELARGFTTVSAPLDRARARALSAGAALRRALRRSRRLATAACVRRRWSMNRWWNAWATIRDVVDSLCMLLVSMIGRTTVWTENARASRKFGRASGRLQLTLARRSHTVRNYVLRIGYRKQLDEGIYTCQHAWKYALNSFLSPTICSALTASGLLHHGPTSKQREEAHIVLLRCIPEPRT